MTERVEMSRAHGLRGLSTASALVAAVSVASSAGCARSKPRLDDAHGPAARPSQEPEPPPRADGRLPPLAVPRAYELTLDVDPASGTFSGTERVDIDVLRRTSWLVLSGRDLRVTEATALVGGKVLVGHAKARSVDGGKSHDELAIAFDEPLPQGKATLAFAWTAPWGDGLRGLYRVKEGDKWYAFTQFEPTDARAVFPCFDEPGFKTPFTLHVTTPKGALAVSNAPEASRVVSPESPSKTTFSFAPTKPLPTYLVALAVGDLDVRPLDRGSATPPVRLITTKGKGDLGDLALDATAKLTDALTAWTQIPYPYEKLDIVAVPEFAAGAMENAGLITFRDALLLLDPQHASVRNRRSQALVIAHELAHQWFGDLVTAAWWNDLWLNEGFATWMEAKAVDAVFPEFRASDDASLAMHGVMDLDALASARAVRQAVASTNEADEAFDGITYQKGAALLRMLETTIGEEAFRLGVHAYLRDNANKSASADRLLAALDSASGSDVTTMASSFLDKPGVPEITVDFSCDRGNRWHAELVSQPWRPLGSRADDAQNPGWTVPVCVAVQGQKSPECATLMAGAPALIGGRGCPGYLHPNARSGYYRFSLTEAQYRKLGTSRKELDVPERIALLSNAWAQIRAGRLAPEAVLSLLPAFDRDSSRPVVEQLAGILWAMDDTLVEDAARSQFRKFVSARFAERKRALGWEPVAPKVLASLGPGVLEGELFRAPDAKRSARTGTSTGPEDDALARRTALSVMGGLAEDEATLREADDVARRWLRDPTLVDADVADVAVDLASRHAGPARLDELRAMAKGAKTREVRSTALRAMVGFDDEPTLTAALDISLGDEVRPHEMRNVLGAAFARRRSRDVAFAWVRAHWEPLRKKLPGPRGVVVLGAMGSACTDADVQERAAFYGPRAGEIEGARRALAEAQEAATLCTALRRDAGPKLTRALLKAK